MHKTLLTRWAFVACFLIATGALGFGLFAQVAWNMRPCPWCTLQRLIFAALSILGLLGLFVDRFVGRFVDQFADRFVDRFADRGASRSASHNSHWLMIARFGIGVLMIAVALAGVSAAAWQSFGPIDPAGCYLTLADRIVQATTLDIRLPLIFAATANCDEANVPLLGIPFALWSMLTFASIALIMLTASAATMHRSLND